MAITHLSKLLLFVSLIGCKPGPRGGTAANNPAPMPDGAYVLKITQVANHPQVRFPDDAIPGKDYKPVTMDDLKVELSDAGAAVKIIPPEGSDLLPSALSGRIEKQDGDSRTYRFDEQALTFMGTLVIVSSPEGLSATLTRFGSGVPVIASYRGTLVRSEPGS